MLLAFLLLQNCSCLLVHVCKSRVTLLLRDADLGQIDHVFFYVRRTYYLSLALHHSAVGGLHSSREAKSAHWPPSATGRRKCKSRVTLLLRDADLGQIDHVAAEPTHGPHHPCSSSSWLGARGPFLAIANVSLDGGST